MTQPPTPATSVQLASARALLHRFLALACADPRAARWSRVHDPELQRLAQAAAAYLGAHPDVRPAALAPGELPPERLDLGPLLAQLDASREAAVALHDRVFGLLVSKECPPYELEYCPLTFSVHRSDQLADVAGFYRAFAVAPGRDAPERPDHVALELEFLGWLAVKELHALRDGAPPEHLAVVRDAERAFVADHLAWWVPAFAHALRAKAGAAGSPLHVALADVLASVVPLERALLGVEPPTVLAEPRSAGLEAPECAGCGAARR